MKGLAACAVLGFQLANMMSRNQFDHLLKDSVTMVHVPISPARLAGYS
jgi:hypothetical protein